MSADYQVYNLLIVAKPDALWSNHLSRSAPLQMCQTWSPLKHFEVEDFVIKPILLKAAI